MRRAMPCGRLNGNDIANWNGGASVRVGHATPCQAHNTATTTQNRMQDTVSHLSSPLIIQCPPVSYRCGDIPQRLMYKNMRNCSGSFISTRCPEFQNFPTTNHPPWYRANGDRGLGS